MAWDGAGIRKASYISISSMVRIVFGPEEIPVMSVKSVLHGQRDAVTMSFHNTRAILMTLTSDRCFTESSVILEKLKANGTTLASECW